MSARSRLAAVAAAALALAVVAALAPCAVALSVSVQGNRLVDANGQTLRPLGVDRGVFDSACVQNYALQDGPTDAASIRAMAAWNINTVRVTLNEDCWLGINGMPNDDDLTGTGVQPGPQQAALYRRAVTDYVAALHQAGLYVVLDLQAVAPGVRIAGESGVDPMPDGDHARDFWTSVASTFKDDAAVIFDLYNEPHDVTWSCWRDGGCTTSHSLPGGGSVAYQAVGFQTLVNVVRATGATQPLLIGGLGYSSDLRQWAASAPTDPGGEIVASAHFYNFNSGPDGGGRAYWDAVLAPLVHRVPVITGEIGEDDCLHGFIDQYMAWADQHGVGYLGWTWNTGGGWTCTGGPILISSYDGTPTAYGVGLRDHLRALASGLSITGISIGKNGTLTVRGTNASGGRDTARATTTRHGKFSAPIPRHTRKHETVNYGSGSTATTGPGRFRLQIKPSAAATKLLKKGRKLRVTVVVTFTSVGGLSTTRTTSIAVKASKANRRR